MHRAALAIVTLLLASACAPPEGSVTGDVADDTDDVAFTANFHPGDTVKVCNATALNQRSGPSATNAVLRVMPQGAQATVITTSGKWVKNDWDGKVGWSSGQYLCLMPATTPPGPGTAGLPGTESPDWSCDGLTSSSRNSAGTYYVTAFGCWVDAAGNDHTDGDDNCIPSCPRAAIGCSGLSGPECERATNWYFADADRFGCGTRVKITNGANGKAAIIQSIDRGPNCRIEQKVDFWVLDISYPASKYLFGGPMSATDQGAVQVEVVDPSTPLGPI